MKSRLSFIVISLVCLLLMTLCVTQSSPSVSNISKYGVSIPSSHQTESDSSQIITDQLEPLDLDSIDLDINVSDIVVWTDSIPEMEFAQLNYKIQYSMLEEMFIVARIEIYRLEDIYWHKVDETTYNHTLLGEDQLIKQHLTVRGTIDGNYSVGLSFILDGKLWLKEIHEIGHINASYPTIWDVPYSYEYEFFDSINEGCIDGFVTLLFGLTFPSSTIHALYF